MDPWSQKRRQRMTTFSRADAADLEESTVELGAMMDAVQDLVAHTTDLDLARTWERFLSSLGRYLDRLEAGYDKVLEARPR